MTRIPIMRPVLGEDEAEEVRRVLLSGWVTQGPEVAAFENELGEALGATHVCAVSSCTAALHLALRAAGVGPGDEVVTVSLSFVATANAIRYQGALPVFVDVEPTTLNVNPSEIESAITDRTRAILCVHQIGMPCDLRRILPLARAHGLPVIEDAACAIGSEVNLAGTWERIGRPHGDIACFSFHPRKILSTGEGGAVTTADPEIAARVQRWRQHSMTVSDTARHSAAKVVFERYVDLGYNYRMTDVQAAIGRVQLRRLGGLVARRRELAEGYRRLLAGVDGLELQHEPDWGRSNFQSLAIRLPRTADQRTVMQRLLDEGIATRRGIMCAHLEPAYGESDWRAAGPGDSLEESRRARDRWILLPLFHDLTTDDQRRVADAVARACSGSSGSTTG